MIAIVQDKKPESISITIRLEGTKKEFLDTIEDLENGHNVSSDVLADSLKAAISNV